MNMTPQPDQRRIRKLDIINRPVKNWIITADQGGET